MGRMQPSSLWILVHQGCRCCINRYRRNRAEALRPILEDGSLMIERGVSKPLQSAGGRFLRNPLARIRGTPTMNKLRSPFLKSPRTRLMV
jgi:hypothetical protein